MATRLEIDDRVVVRLSDGRRVGGWITGRQGAAYRVVTDAYRRLRVSRRRLTRGRENVLLLESRLDRTLRSYRHQGTFLRELLKPFDTEVLYEKVHTKGD